MAKDTTIAVYYFPNYHLDVRNRHVHGEGWTEWELVRRAEPRYPGHRQPRLPLWGYEDEADPQVVARKIAAAAGHGVDVFLFDWYWYDDGPFLQRGLEEGYLQAPNNTKVKFAIHWANHDWIDIHPAKLNECLDRTHRLLYPGKITEATFNQVTDYVIDNYFEQPSYYKIDGAPYFSFYDLNMLVTSFGSVEATRQALAAFRQKTKAAGFPDLHLNQVLWNLGVLPGETAARNPAELLPALGFDSFTSYVWIHHVPLDAFPETDYTAVFNKYLDYWTAAESQIRLPYFPNATMGWDSSPRTVQSDVFLNAGYPFTPCLSDNTPRHFRDALRQIKARLEQRQGNKILTINAWNEWTEGSYLEPDTFYGMGYLEAIRDVFGK
jgi:hypothetical protein